MKGIILVTFSLFLLAFLILITLHPGAKTATIDNHQFFIDIASLPKDQEIGLSKYTSFPRNRGMYFPFSHPDTYRFWMKNMHFPIDIIFIRDNRIVNIVSSVSAPINNQTALPTYGPSSPINAVLEINAGLSEKYGFKKGDTVQLVQ